MNTEHHPNRQVTTRRAVGIVAIVATALFLTGCLSSYQTTDADLVNGARKTNRLSALSIDSKAASKAQAWSSHMASTGRLEHTGGGSKLDTTGVSGWCGYAENVGKGPSIEGIHKAFLASPAHKANILSRSHRLGTGVVKKGSTYWVTEIFLRNC